MNHGCTFYFIAPSQTFIAVIAPAKRVMRDILTYLFVPLLCKLLDKVIAFLVANFSGLTFTQLPAHAYEI